MAINTGPDIEYARGDTIPVVLQFTGPVGFTWTGYTDIELTVNSELDPADNTTQIMQMTGTPTGTNNDVSFVPPDQVTTNALIVDTYFYDVQALDAQGRKGTIIKGGAFIVIQDINKD